MTSEKFNIYNRIPELPEESKESPRRVWLYSTGYCQEAETIPIIYF